MNPPNTITECMAILSDDAASLQIGAEPSVRHRKTSLRRSEFLDEFATTCPELHASTSHSQYVYVVCTSKELVELLL